MNGIIAELDIGRLQSRLTDLARSQIPFATAGALNDTAFEAREAVIKEVDRTFVSPTPFTRRGVRVRKATKQNPVAHVYIPPIQARYLRKQIEGGARRNVRKPGGALPAPADARLNRYGNLTRNQIKTLLSKPNTFRRTINGVDGIWQRMKRGRRKLKLLVVFSRQQHYRPRFDFEGPIRQTVQRVYRKNFGRRLGQAIRTTRTRFVANAVLGR